MNSPYTILICERFSLEAELHLKKNNAFCVTNLQKNQSQEEQNKKFAKANALIIRSKFKIDSNLLNKTPHLKLIVTCTSGFDHIDLTETQRRQITVMYTPDANIVAAAEHTWALLLASVRNLIPAHKYIKSGNNPNWNREPFLSFELENKTLGIIGLGRIGQKVCHYAKAFNMNVIVFDPYQDQEVFEKLDVIRCSYEEVLKQSDILTFHVPATFETHHMLNKSHFEYLSGEQILINASRGSVINEDDLIEALNQNKIKYAGLDVFQKEPLSRDSQLLKCHNVLMTPHLGAFTQEAFTKASLEAAKLIELFFVKNQTRNTLPLVNHWGTLSFKERT